MAATDSISENKNNDISDLSESENLDYSKTNNQVENVDEADIVKTDGKYIYYSQNDKVYIVDKDLNLKATIKDDKFSPYQIFVNEDKLVVFGNVYNSNLIDYELFRKETNSLIEEDCISYTKPKTFARVYDLNNIENPKLVRELSIDGYYSDARMIDDNIYFVSNYNINFYKDLQEMKDEEILPAYSDSLSSKEDKTIAATDIAYFEDSKNYNYSLIAGFNLNSDDEVNIETFFGFGNEMYVSENNMYIVCENYKNLYNLARESSTIYKFELKDSTIIAKASCEIDGYINNQFSIDEYEGNLRVATTSYKSYNGNNSFNSKEDTQLTILNENLEKIGGIDSLIEDEKIYAVRFIGNVGYIVTFEQVDPLWVIDLSDPTNPVVKGELEIPGYSSYLHPYDETHIIGIGYDVKSNGYGGVTNDTIKLSMFDVSDLENPKEIFKINLTDDEYAYSNIMYDHKALFFNKAKNLIGFPIESWSYRNNKAGLMLFRIDLENNRFEEIDSLIDETSDYDYAERAIYIGENAYVLYDNYIVQYDISSFEKKGSIKL